MASLQAMQIGDLAELKSTVSKLSNQLTQERRLRKSAEAKVKDLQNRLTVTRLKEAQ